MNGFSSEEQLVNAIAANDLAKVKDLLPGLDNVNYQSVRSGNYSLLHFAAQSQSSEITELLLAKGANIELTDKHENTPLWTAVLNYRGDGKVIELLLKHGANANHKNLSGKSPGEVAHLISNYDVSKYFEDEKQ